MKGSAGPVSVGTGPDWEACAVGGSWGWAELETPSAAEVASAGKPAANWLLSLHSLPVEAGSFVPYFLAASAACDAASVAAAAGGTQLPGAAETDYGWPFQDPTLVLHLAAAAAAGGAVVRSSAVSLKDPGIVGSSPNGSCSLAASEGSSRPWLVEAAVAVVAAAWWASGRLLAWGSCSAWLGLGAPLLAALAWPAVAEAQAVRVAFQAALAYLAGSEIQHT